MPRRWCAPPDGEFAELLARVGVPHVPFGPSVRAPTVGAKPPTAGDAFRLAPALVTEHFEKVGPAAEGCDALVATGLIPAGAPSVAERHGLRYVYAGFHSLGLPSPHWPTWASARPTTAPPPRTRPCRRRWRWP
ncbi:hypothetical protein [Streptomyces ossamyceticus]|uniref:hypothetical protein n=1 Tax=Streptomyces ossamyceticus TaxID=249581 RepID=UPI0006E2067E